MDKINSYQDLQVWQKAVDLCVEVYRLVKLLPKEEMYSLSDQMRRAVVSIPSNIAEGYARKTTKEYLKFLSIANGSRTELETQLIICNKIGYLNEKEIEVAMQKSTEIGKMISTIAFKLTNK